MPDFTNFVVRAPYEADLVFGRNQMLLRVDEVLEIPIAFLPAKDLQQVATVTMPHIGDPALQVEFVHHGGRLFRPYLDPNKRDLWTSERCKAHPPSMEFAGRWGEGLRRTAALSSPFRPSYAVTTDAHRQQARKQAPQALQETRSRVTGIVQSGLLFVDDVLFQETVTPGRTVHARPNRSVLACLPDLVEAPGLTLVDPRYPLNQVLGVCGGPEPKARIEIHEASLLPPTIERDALGCFAVHIRNRDGLTLSPEIKGSFAHALHVAADAIEATLRDGASRESCYAAVAEVADWDRPKYGIKGFDAICRAPSRTRKSSLDTS